MEPKIVLMDREFSRESLGELDALDLRNIKDGSWETVLSACRADELRLYHIMMQSIDGIERLRTTSRLSMEWANKITDLSPVFKMSWLKYLFLSDFPKLADIEGIGSLQNVTELHLSGNRGSLQPPLRMVSVQPISKLSNLETLTLVNLRLENDDITFLASLPKLRDLALAINGFDRKQFAYLAKRLNPQLHSPITASKKMNSSCPKCGNSLFFFVGKRMPYLCRSCENERFEKLTLQFENLMAAS
jgi:Leucine-rich repeat (LRR) protein